MDIVYFVSTTKQFRALTNILFVILIKEGIGKK